MLHYALVCVGPEQVQDSGAPSELSLGEPEGPEQGRGRRVWE